MQDLQLPGEFFLEDPEKVVQEFAIMVHTREQFPLIKIQTGRNLFFHGFFLLMERRLRQAADLRLEQVALYWFR